MIAELKIFLEAKFSVRVKGHYRILVLEVNSIYVDVMSSFLKKSSMEHKVKMVSSKEDFIPAVNGFDPDVILANYFYPLINGENLLKGLRERHQHVPFILIADELSEKLVRDCLREGVDDFVHFENVEHLPGAINRALEKKRNEREGAIRNFELQRAHEDLRVKLARQNAANEEERLQLARDLHEELGQVLSALKIDINMFGRKVFERLPSDAELLHEEFQSIISNIERITATVKRMTSGLRPEMLDELGVIEAIRWLVRQLKKKHGIHFELDLPEEVRGDSVFPITLYRIVQGALENLIHHTNANTIELIIKEKGDKLALKVKANGKTCDKAAFNLKIIEIRERLGFIDGTLAIQNSRPYGKTLLATIPLGKSQQPAP
ncbi:ATP-binding response regulator [Marinoscillum furvescens]|nr:response regulator [Marinoscillum furvescens]